MADDELARTATAPATSQEGRVAVGAQLGRYRIEQELGSGGMGVVYAAFDPDLERRIALKVLRIVDTGEARQRLLREARAMARLRHPNIVVVYEVGSADGLDFVAMELLEAGSLADWLKDSTREPSEILDAFIAAGRGLAAAHAAGIVHRDFKPHNIVRGRDGRILVTDFGLARDATNPLETTLPVGATQSGQTSLSGITMTGAVVGTPAYMAPEQWQGGRVGPAADQFAFCVALWEALAGERPFRGTTAEQMRELVARGPASLDDSKLPRRVRGALRRGLAPDPDKRWPSMAALLDALAPKRSRIALSAIGIGVAIIASAALLMRGGSSDRGEPASCVSAHAIANVWSPEARGRLLGAGRSALVPLFEADATAWRDARDEACAASPDVARGECLAGVVDRMKAVLGAVEASTGTLDPDAVAAQLVDPHACNAGGKLVVSATPQTVAAFGLAIHAEAASGIGPVAAEFAARAELDACPRAIALIAEHDATGADAARAKIATDAVAAAEECKDDRVRADASLRQIAAVVTSGDAAAQAKLDATAAIVSLVPQDDLRAQLDIARAQLAQYDHNLDRAIALATDAADAYAKRGLGRAQARAMSIAVGILLIRGTRADLEQVRTLTNKWRPIADGNHYDDAATELAREQAYAQFYLGDTIDAHATLNALWHPDPWQPGVKKWTGKVVDGKGKPVSGATVAASSHLYTDGRGIFAWSLTDPLQMATTDEHGEFAIDAVDKDSVVALDKTERSSPAETADDLVLALAPTRTLTGKVEGEVGPKTFVGAGPHGQHFLDIAPVGNDGVFEIAGAPLGELEVGIYTLDSTGGTIDRVHVPAGKADVHDIVLHAVTGTRSLQVVVHGTGETRPAFAVVIAMPGRHPVDIVSELDGMSSSTTQFASRNKDGELAANYDHLAAGELTVCAVGLGANLADARVFQRHFKDLAVHCEIAGPDAKSVVVETPPQKRYE